MKITYRNIILSTALGAMVMALPSCSDNSKPGLEYMPDMYRSPSIEAYVDYGEVRNRTNDSLKNTQSALVPPAGTVPYYTEDVEVMLPYAIGAPLDEGVQRGWFDAKTDSNGLEKAKLVKNPLTVNEENLANGQHLYTSFCQHCHGEKGDGNGSIVESGSYYVVPPKYKLEMSEGEYFYYITYGKNVMGSHASLLNQKERWQVAMYVKALSNGGEYPSAAPASTEESAATEGTDAAASEESKESSNS